jgi:hypothetical protein
VGIPRPANGTRSRTRSGEARPAGNVIEAHEAIHEVRRPVEHAHGVLVDAGVEVEPLPPRLSLRMSSDHTTRALVDNGAPARRRRRLTKFVPRQRVGARSFELTT